MAQPKKSSAGVGAKAPDEEARSTLVTVCDLLARSVMLPSDRIRDTLDSQLIVYTEDDRAAVRVSERDDSLRDLFGVR